MLDKAVGLARTVSRSLTGKFLAVALVFLIVPVILYTKFAEADAERQAFLLRALQAEGLLVAQDLRPSLTSASGRSLLDIARSVHELAADQMRVKLLLRPAGQSDSFFLVASNPAIESADLDEERRRLDAAGVLPRLDESCDGDRTLALRYEGASGAEELLTSMSPLHSPAGCWVVLTSYSTGDLVGASLARPFIDAPEVHLAVFFYGLMALLIVLTVIGTLFDIKGFATVARRIREGGAFGKPSFAAIVAVPELRPVAREFDRMVATLDASASALREAAEDNAHAFKAPIAAITQAIEPLKELSTDDQRAHQAVAAIHHALKRLGSLVQAVRRLDEAAAEVMSARLQPQNLGQLATQMAQAYDRVSTARGVRVTVRAEENALVTATAESLETVIENLLDNAVSFSPRDGVVLITVRRTDARNVMLSVEDEGPGVPVDQLGSIFRRNFSYRPKEQEGDGIGHSGIGLAVVRRTVELLGGEVGAENLKDQGFRVYLTLPSA
jgi:two-component system sensor histidine kinase ChvG